MAPRDQDRPASGLLRRSLEHPAGAPGVASNCPAPDILAAFFERALDAAETAHCELHFSQCPRCREQLAALARADEFAAAGGEAAQHKPDWARVWNWRWLAPAAAVLAIVMVWVARRPEPRRTSEQTPPAPLVAMSRPAEPPVSPPARESLSETKVEAPSASVSAAPATRTAPELSLDTARSAPSRQMSAPAHATESVENLPLRNRNYAEVDALAKADQAPEHATAQNVVPGAAAPTMSAGASQPARSSAPPSRPPTPALEGKEMNTGETVVVEAEAAAGALQTEQTVPSQATKAKQVAASPMANNYAVQAEMAAVQTAEKRSTETLIHTPNRSVQWRIARGGPVERSLDGGATWQAQELNVGASLVAGSAPTAKVCWLVGRNGIIVRTQDGTKWKTIPPPVPADFVAVAARDASSATVTAADGRQFSTGDGGKHWNALP